MAGLVVVVVGVGGWWRYPGLIAAGVAFAGLALLDVAAVVRPGQLRVSRVVEPLRLPRHGHCAAMLTLVHNGRRLPVMVDGVEPVGDELVPIQGNWLRPGKPVDIGYQVPSHSRGLRVVGPTRLRRLGPAGLMARTESVGDEAVVLVLPRVLAVRAMPAGARRGQVTSDERVARGGTDLVGMHEYLPGDDLRHIHWATSARTGTLMVRDDADPSHAELTVVLDDRAASYGDDAGSAAAFEDAVDVAASLTAAGSAAGHPVRLRTISGQVDVAHAGTGTATGRPAPELLAVLADVTLVDAVSATAVSTPYDFDVVALISGPAADEAGLALEAGRAVVGVVLVIDPRPATRVRASGPVLVLRGPRAEDLLSHWDATVADGKS